jgi:hypothetical protein
VPPRRDLVGRDDLIGRARELLARGQSVLLFGPERIGKSAIVSDACLAALAIEHGCELITTDSDFARAAVGRGRRTSRANSGVSSEHSRKASTCPGLIRERNRGARALARRARRS